MTGREEDALVARGLELGYGSRVVLRDVSLTARAREFWFLLGPNGSGKSTFARAALGLLAPRQGTLATSCALAFVPQQHVLHATLPMTLRELVWLGLGDMRLAADECARRTAWAIDTAGLAGLERRDVRDLSGGQRQRASVARALVRQPGLLVLDEPTSNLDPASTEALLEVLDRLRRESDLALVFVSHDVAEAVHHATHVALFHGGTVVAGTRDLLFAPGLLERVYGVDPLAGRGYGSGSAS